MRSLLVFLCPPRLQPGVFGLLVLPETCGHFADKTTSRKSRLDICKRKSKVLSNTFVYESVTSYEEKDGAAPARQKRCFGCLFGSVATGRSTSRFGRH